MFNEHVYRCSLNNKRTILSNSPENQQANKLCEILSFHARRFFEHNVARFRIYPAQDGTSIKETIVEQHVNFESGRWFLCSNTHTKLRVSACWNQCFSVCVFESYSKEEDVRFQFISWTEDERTKYGRMEGRKSLATEERMRYPPVVATISHYKLLCVGDIKTEKGNKTM